MAPGSSREIKFSLKTTNKIGRNRIILKVKEKNEEFTISKDFEVINSEIRSTRLIDGAWAGLYHWSEIEGKYWNPDIKR